MQGAGLIPGDLKLVVSPSRAGVVRERWPTVAVFVLATTAAGFGFGASGSVAWLVVGLACVLGVVVEALVVRSSLALGPALAADADHLWVRVGGFLRPASVRLDWPEVTGLRLRTWQGRRRNSARYLTIQLTDEASATLAGTVARRRRRLAAAFGAPLAISEQHKTPNLDEAVRALRALAPEGVRFANG